MSADLKLNYESVGHYVSAQAEGTPEEIAALVVAFQERRDGVGSPLATITAVVRKAIDGTAQEEQAAL